MCVYYLTLYIIFPYPYFSISYSFICPVTGVYYISVNLKKTSTVIASLGWYIGISWQTSMQLVEENDNNDGTTVSGSRLVTCAVGEDFLVRMFGSADNYVYGEPGIPHSTFTIMLLHKNGMLGESLVFQML